MHRTIPFLLFLATVTIHAAPHISRVEPASGLATGGTYVHLFGSDLTGFALACPSIDCSNYVQFGGVMAPIAGGSDREIVVIAPPHDPGPVDVLINVAGKGKVTIPAGFRYEEADDADVERFLLPIVNGGPGAYGSLWKSEVTMHNGSDSVIFPEAPNGNPIILSPCPHFMMQPHETVHPGLYPTFSTPYAIVRVQRKVADTFDIQLRVQDVSRQEQTWGTAIPVVRTTDYRATVRLHDVPSDARFRDTLRIYGYEGGNFPVSVKVSDETTGAVIATMQLDTIQTVDRSSYAQIVSLRDTFPQIASHERVRIEVESLATTARQPLWAMVTVTNNETQHVTIIAPR